MYSDFVFYIFSLPTETKIIFLQTFVLVTEIFYFFWLRKYFKEEEIKIREQYQRKS